MALSDEFEYACLTDVGIRRSHNQDNHAVLLAADANQWLEHGHLFLVADGMGAHAVGEKASEQAARVIPHTYNKHFQEGPATALRKALSEANASIHAFGQANREFAGTGTTSTALVLRPDGAWVGHVGDSRVYRVRAGQIEQLSYDHSLVWEYARLKRIDPSEVKDIPSNVIHRCLGPEPLVQVDVEGPHPLQAGDVFVLCSDGLSGPVNDREIGAVATVLPPVEACRYLVDLANLRGGPDNITVLIIRVKVTPEANGAVAKQAPPPPRRFHWPPWPLACLVGGTLLAAIAIFMHTVDVPRYLPVFLLGSITLVAGFVGLLLDARKANTSGIHPRRPAPPRIHRRTACPIEMPLIERLVKTLHALRQHADEKKWVPNWSLFQQHHDLAAELLARQDLPGAFREYCRALLPLTEAMQRYRNKGEEFKPHWD